MTSKHSNSLVDSPVWPCCDTADYKQEVEKLHAKHEQLACVLHNLAAALVNDWLGLYYGDAEDLPARERDSLAGLVADELGDGVQYEDLDIGRLARDLIPDIPGVNA